MNKEARELWQQIFIRVCRDSGFQLPMERAAALTGNIVGAPALLIWTAFPSLDVMQDVASGTHPSAIADTRPKGGDSLLAPFTSGGGAGTAIAHPLSGPTP